MLRASDAAPVQWDTNASNVVFSEVVVAADPSVGVTVAEATAGMRRLQSQIRPRSAQRAAQPAIDRALRWIANRPPAGVSSIGNVHSSYFAYQRFTDARVDVENLAGTNLRQ